MRITCCTGACALFLCGAAAVAQGQTNAGAAAASDPVWETFDPEGPYDDAGVEKQPDGPEKPDLPGPADEGAPGDDGDNGLRGGPPNDFCSNATVIPGNAVNYNPALLNTTGALTEICEPAEDCEAGAQGVSHSVYYRYTPDQDGTIFVTTSGSTYNTVLSVFDGCGSGFPSCNQPTLLACGDDQIFGATYSSVLLDVEAGQTYIIKAADWDFDSGNAGLLDFNFQYRPPNDLCADATPISGVAFNPPLLSTHNASTENCEALEPCELNNVGVSNTVWYRFVAPCDGLISLNTNGSTYDTVLSVFDGCGEFVNIDAPCNLPALIACDDDSGTGLSSQLLSVPVTGGVEYRIKVADYNTSQGGGWLDFNLVFSGASPPVAEIDSPAALECVCGPVAVSGSANTSGDPFVEWELESQPVGGGSSWALIAAGSNPVTNNTLAVWNTAALAQGNYVLRLTVRNACGVANTAVEVVFVDRQFDSFDLRAPQTGVIVGGDVCIDGTVWDRCFDSYTVEYRPSGGGVYQPVAAPLYTSTVITDPLVPGGWDTLLGGVVDGDYELKVEGVDQCGNPAATLVDLTIDNTPPVAEIISPLNCDGFEHGLIEIAGTASDANLNRWILQYSGGPTNGWVTIAQGGSSVVNGVLATWDTSALPSCAYALRLSVIDRSIIHCDDPQRSEHVVTIDVGGAPRCPGDFDGDGQIGLPDLAFFLSIFGTLCP